MVDAALQALTDSSSIWRHADVIREIARAVTTNVAVPADQLIDQITSLANRFENVWCVDLAPPVATNVRRRESDDRPLTESVIDRRFTTNYILEQEEHLATWAFNRWQTRLRPRTDTTVLDTAGLDSAVLDKAQAAAAAAIVGRDPLVVVVGLAGAGKTTALRPAVAHLHNQRRPVFGVAPSATAAAVLAEQTGLATDTIAKLMLETPTPRRAGSGGWATRRGRW